MPIQIRELVIRATVDEGSNNEPSSATGSSTGKKKESQEKIIRRCVDEVLEVLRLQNEY